MRERVMNENIDTAGHDIKRRGTEITFFAHDLALSVAMQNRRAFRPIIKLRTRHFLERRQILDQLIDAQRFACKFFNDLLHISSFWATAPKKYIFRAPDGRT